MKALRLLGAEPQRFTYAPSVTSALAFVAAGLGYSLIPWPGPRGPSVRGIVSRELRGRDSRFPVLACYRTTSQPDPALDALLRLSPS